jgi:hypothetical protein
MAFDNSDTGIMYTDVPTKGVRTLYPKVGKAFGWLSALGLLVLVVTAIRKSRG